jgi:hypothetical protein
MSHPVPPSLRRLPLAALGSLLAVVLLATLAGARPEPLRADGRALVRGLLLGSGPVAEALPEVFGRLPQLPDEAREQEEAMLDAIARQDPGLFEEFDKALHSGDRAVVMAALDDASQRLQDVVAVADDFVAFPYHYHWTWLPYRWHFRWHPFQWDYDYDYDWSYRWGQPWYFELDPESQLARERFADLVVERVSERLGG